jgi:hypothetical protein
MIIQSVKAMSVLMLSAVLIGCSSSQINLYSPEIVEICTAVGENAEAIMTAKQFYQDLSMIERDRLSHRWESERKESHKTVTFMSNILRKAADRFPLVSSLREKRDAIAEFKQQMVAKCYIDLRTQQQILNARQQRVSAHGTVISAEFGNRTGVLLMKTKNGVLSLNVNQGSHLVNWCNGYDCGVGRNIHVVYDPTTKDEYGDGDALFVELLQAEF